MFAGATLASGCWTDAKTPATTIDHKQIDTTPAVIPAGTIRGRVVNTATGEPLRGVSVEIRLPSGDIVYATSNQQGEFEFKNLAPGKYTVEYLSGDPREPPQGRSVTLAEGTGSYVDVPIAFPEPDRGPCCKPYGAPPARRRIV
ncbi:MAG TPA: carboxypeptidase-like regulatory domain-containing protein [Kofleriaceae bacterium]